MNGQGFHFRGNRKEARKERKSDEIWKERERGRDEYKYKSVMEYREK